MIVQFNKIINQYVIVIRLGEAGGQIAGDSGYGLWDNGLLVIHAARVGADTNFTNFNLFFMMGAYSLLSAHV